jgi:hypothetical protein
LWSAPNPCFGGIFSAGPKYIIFVVVAAANLIALVAVIISASLVAFNLACWLARLPLYTP